MTNKNTTPASTLDVTLFEKIENLVKGINIENLTKSESTTVIRNKTNHSLTVKDFDEALSKGLNLADYEKHTEVSSPKFDVILSLFGSKDYQITKTEKKVINKLQEVVEALAGKVVESTAVTTKKESTKTDFQKAQANITSKITAEKGKLKKETVEEKKAEIQTKIAIAEKERIQLYIDNQKLPKGYEAFVLGLKSEFNHFKQMQWYINACEEQGVTPPVAPAYEKVIEEAKAKAKK